MEALTLKEIAKATGGETNFDVTVTSVCIDTRKITKGCLFICIKGARFDAHQFADEALRLGAAAVMLQNDLQPDGPYVKVRDTAKALLELSAYYRLKFDIPVVGLTGSVGKTTTKEFTYLVVSSKFNTIKTIGNLNNEIGLPQTLFQIDGNTQAAVIEMGMNHFGEIHRLSSATRPTVGVITNIGSSHIENLGSREGILKAKLELLDGLKPGSPLILNGDNDMLAGYENSEFDVSFFAIENKSAQFRAVNIVEIEASTSFDIEYTADSISALDGNASGISTPRQSVKLPTIGIHNVYNALAAFAVGIKLGIESQMCADALSQYSPEGMRQRVVNVGGVTSIEDCYNASPDSMKAALKTLCDIKGNKKIAVLGDMLELGEYSEEAHSKLGKTVAESNVDFLLTYGDAARLTAESARQSGMKKAYSFDNKEALGKKLVEITSNGDVVLFKASRGMKLEDVICYAYDRWEK